MLIGRELPLDLWEGDSPAEPRISGRSARQEPRAPENTTVSEDWSSADVLRLRPKLDIAQGGTYHVASGQSDAIIRYPFTDLPLIRGHDSACRPQLGPIG